MGGGGGGVSGLGRPGGIFKMAVLFCLAKTMVSVLPNKPSSWISPHEVLQSWLINKVKWRIIRGRGSGLKREGGLLIFFPWRWGGELVREGGGLKGTGWRFSACSLIKLLFSNLLLILSVNNPIHMYLGDFRVYFKVEVYFSVTWSRLEGY